MSERSPESFPSSEDELHPAFEQRELLNEEKEEYARVWNSAVLGRVEATPDVSRWTTEQFKDWLYDGVKKEARLVVEEWGLRPDSRFEEAIRQSPDDSVRSQQELAYIVAFQEKVHSYQQQHRDSFRGDQMMSFDSWPAIMRESKVFNCVGGALLGLSELTRVGIRTSVSFLPDHTALVAELSDGRRYYIDVVSEQRIPFQDAREIQIDNGRFTALAVQEPLHDYMIFPLMNPREIISSISGNLVTVQEAGRMLQGHKEDIEEPFRDLDEGTQQDIRHIYDVFGASLQAPRLFAMHLRLFPERMRLQETKELISEKERLKKLHQR